MKILVPIDGSTYSDAVIQEMTDRPWPAGTQVRVISVAHPSPDFFDPLLVASALHMDSLNAERRRARNDVDKARQTIAQGTHLLDVSAEVIEGSPKEAILEDAAQWGADLIMLGTHGRGAATRFLLGSVSHDVALQAPCSVEIVRSRLAKTALQDDRPAV